MSKDQLKNQLEAAGHNLAEIYDYLDTERVHSFEDFLDYQNCEDSTYRSQSYWHSTVAQSIGLPSSTEFGSAGFAAMINKTRGG